MDRFRIPLGRNAVPSPFAVVSEADRRMASPFAPRSFPEALGEFVSLGGAELEPSPSRFHACLPRTAAMICAFFLHTRRNVELPDFRVGVQKRASVVP